MDRIIGLHDLANGLDIDLIVKVRDDIYLSDLLRTYLLPIVNQCILREINSPGFVDNINTRKIFYDIKPTNNTIPYR